MTFSSGHALVIGIGTYQYNARLNVPVTRNDAQQVADLLASNQYCGYPANQVTFLSDETATRSGILAALDQLAGRTNQQPDATIVLFYAGHGHFSADDDYYLTTHDTEITDAGTIKEGTGIRARELLERLKVIEAKRVLLFFNACHSGVLSPNSLDTGDTLELIGHNLPDDLATALLSTGEGRVVITACRAQQKSYFSYTGNTTVFGQALADGLRGAGVVSRRGYISVFDLYDYIFSRVKETVKAEFDAQQEPELTINKGVGVMAVALYQGAIPSGNLDLENRPDRLPGATREIDRAESDRKFQQILNGTINLAAARDATGNTVIGGNQTTVQGNQYTAQGDQHIVHGDQIDAGQSQGFINQSTGSVTQHFGDKQNINTSGGDYAEGNIDKRKGIFGGTFSGGAIGVMEGGSVLFSAPSPATTAPAQRLQAAYAQIQQQVDAARQRGDHDLADDLDSVARTLDAAIKAEREGKGARRTEKKSESQIALQRLAQQYPNLQAIIEELQAA